MEDSLPSYQSAREQQSSQQTPTTPSSAGNSGGKIPVKELLELVIPELQLSCIRLAVPVPRTEEMLLKLDEQMVKRRTFLSKHLKNDHLNPFRYILDIKSAFCIVGRNSAQKSKCTIMV